MPKFDDRVLEGLSILSVQAREVLLEECTIARQEAINDLNQEAYDGKEPIHKSIQAANFMIEHLEEAQREFASLSQSSSGVGSRPATW